MNSFVPVLSEGPIEEFSAVKPSPIQVAKESPVFMEALHSNLDEKKSSSEHLSIAEGELHERTPPGGNTDTNAWKNKLEETLYDRVDEKETLLRCCDSLKQDTKASLLLISGPCGAGKTRLANSLRKPVEQQHDGYFLTGKFDQLQRREPYPALVAAFTDFTNMVIERGELEISRIRNLILEAVGNETCVLVGMIPALERIIGKKDTAKCTATLHNALKRFVFVFRRFMRAVCSPEAPVVLLMDDLQWADPCSLDALAGIVTGFKKAGLMIVGTCDDTVEADSLLSSKLRRMEKQDANITHIPIGNLEEHVVDTLIRDAFALNNGTSGPLSKIVWQQTNGNAFYVLEFLRWLQDSGLLIYDTSAESWEWDEDEIGMSINKRRVGDFLFDRLGQLSRELKEALKVSACLGSHVNRDLVEHGLGAPVGSVLDEAVAMGILVPSGSRGDYAFAHDGLQEVAYSLIPENEKEIFHMKIGRRLWRRLDREELDHNIFVVLSQMKIGHRHITKEKEKVGVATLCLHAGNKAARSSTFRTAAAYLNLGIEILGNRRWRNEYELTLSLHNAAAEMELCCSGHERMNELVEDVLQNARSFHDKVQAYCTKIYSLGVSDRQQEALDLGIEILRGLGEKFPSRLCRFHLMSEMKKVRKLLKGKSDEQILRLPRIHNKEKLAACQVLQLLYLNALLARPKLSPFIVLKLMQISMRYGLSAFSSCAFSAYGMLCISASRDIDEAFRFGQVGLRLLESFKAMEFLPRVYASVYGVIHSWKKPMKECLEPLQQAHRVGMITGDLEYSSLCANQYCFHALESGVPLHVIHRHFGSFRETMISNKQETLFKMGLPCVQAVHHYMGLTSDPFNPKGDVLDLELALQEAIESRNIVQATEIRAVRMAIAFVFNKYELASENAMNIDDLWLLPPSFEQASLLWIRGLVALAMVREGKGTRKNTKVAKRAIKEFRSWATHSPHNFLDKLFLLEAELASVCGQNAEAYAKYVCSIAMATDSSFLYNIGLANELAARHLFFTGGKGEAKLFFERACLAYEEWGGKAKLGRLQDEVDSMYASIIH